MTPVDGPLTAGERWRARWASPPPVPDREPRRRPAPRRWPKAALAAALVPASAVARTALRVAGRSGRLDPARVRSIAFIKLDHLGDVLMATPLLRALKAWAPHADLVAFVRPASADAALRCPAVDEVELAEVPWIRPGSPPGDNLRACTALARRVASRRFDLVVDLRYHNRLDSLLLSLCGARARLGFDAGGFGFGITHRAAWPAGGHEVDRGAVALEEFGIPVPDRAPEFPVSPEERAAAARLTRGGPFAALHVGAGNAIKRWMPDRWAWVARALVRRTGLRVAVLSGPGEEALGAPVLAALGARQRIDLRARLRLGELAAVIGRSTLFLGNDGGAAHLAAAVGARSVIVFSGTNEARQWAPRSRAPQRLLERWVPCKPCHATDCPFDVACLRAVPVDDVLAAAVELAGRMG